MPQTMSQSRMYSSEEQQLARFPSSFVCATTTMSGLLVVTHLFAFSSRSHMKIDRIYIFLPFVVEKEKNEENFYVWRINRKRCFSQVKCFIVHGVVPYYCLLCVVPVFFSFIFIIFLELFPPLNGNVCR